jgi:uncharacterized membrane protein
MRGRHRSEDGAVAVEMAILTPLLLLLLFGIIQYGMLFHALQGASATARDAARWAATGVSDCTDYQSAVRDHAQGNGVPVAPDPWQVTLTYQGSPTPDTALVELSFTPQSLVPMIPMPGRLTERALARVEDAGAVRVSGCTVQPGP